MTDINELRRLTQEATPGPWYIGSGIYEGRNIYSVEAVTDDEGFTYNPVVATAEDDEVACWDANARLIAAANPAGISELLDRLEAAEKDSAHHKALAESALRVAKGWEEKCNSLRAKIAEMEKQGPIGEIVAFGESLHEVSWIKGKLPLLGAKLYALPGAKGEEK